MAAAAAAAATTRRRGTTGDHLLKSEVKEQVREQVRRGEDMLVKRQTGAPSRPLLRLGWCAKLSNDHANDQADRCEGYRLELGEPGAVRMGGQLFWKRLGRGISKIYIGDTVANFAEYQKSISAEFTLHCAFNCSRCVHRLRFTKF